MTKLKGALVLLVLLLAAALMPQRPSPSIAVAVVTTAVETTTTIPVATTVTTTIAARAPSTVRQRSVQAAEDRQVEVVDASGLAPAKRLGPPEPHEQLGIGGRPFAPEGLGDCAEMNYYRIQWDLPYRFSDQPRTGAKGFGWRESNCRNEDGVHTSCCYGYWQLHKDHFYPGNIFATECGVDSYLDINSDTPIDKQRQACAAHRLFLRDGYSPWQ